MDSVPCLDVYYFFLCLKMKTGRPRTSALQDCFILLFPLPAMSPHPLVLSNLTNTLGHGCSGPGSLLMITMPCEEVG